MGFGTVVNMIGRHKDLPTLYGRPGYSFAATTTGDSAAPPIGDYWLKMTDAVVSSETLPPNVALATDKDVYALGGVDRIEGNIGSGVLRQLGLNVEGTGSFVQVGYVGTGAGSTFNPAIYESSVQKAINTGVVLDKSQNIYWLLEYDNAAEDWVLYVNGAEACRYDCSAFPRAPEATAIHTAASVVSGVTTYRCGVHLLWRTTSDDRANPDGETLSKNTDGNGNYDEWGSEANPETSGAADYTKYDDMNSGGSPDDDTTFNGCNNRTARQSSTTENKTHTYTPVALAVGARLRPNVADKELFVDLFTRESSTDLDKSVPVLIGTGYVGRAVVFELAPGAAAWTQTKLDNVEIGIERIVGSDDMNAHCTALGCDSLGLRAFVPAAADRRRSFGAVI